MSTTIYTLDFIPVFSDVLHDERVGSATCVVNRPEGSYAKLFSDNNPEISIAFDSFDDEICLSYSIAVLNTLREVVEYHDGEIADLPHAVASMIDKYF